MFKQPKFDVLAVPVGKAVIQQSKERANRILRINTWLFLPALGLVIYAGLTSGRFFIVNAISSHSFDNAVIMIPLGGVMFGCVVIVFLILVLSAWTRVGRDSCKKFCFFL